MSSFIYLAPLEYGALLRSCRTEWLSAPLQPSHGPCTLTYLLLHLYWFSDFQNLAQSLVYKCTPPTLVVFVRDMFRVYVSADFSGSFREWEKVNVYVPTVFNQKSHVALQLNGSGPGMLKQLAETRFGTCWHFHDSIIKITTKLYYWFNLEY